MYESLSLLKLHSCFENTFRLNSTSLCCINIVMFLWYFKTIHLALTCYAVFGCSAIRFFNYSWTHLKELNTVNLSSFLQLYFLWYFIEMYIINKTLQRRLEIRNFSSCVGKYFKSERRKRVKYFSTLEEKSRFSKRPCNILYLFMNLVN